MSRQSPGGDALNSVLLELRGLRADVHTLHSEAEHMRKTLDAHMRLSEAKSGELRAEIATVKTEIANMKSLLGTVKEGMQAGLSGVQIGIDSANDSLRSELEVVKAAVRTTQVTIADLSGRMDGMEAANRVVGVKRQRVDLEASHCEHHYASPPSQAVRKAVPSQLGEKTSLVGSGLSEEEVEPLDAKEATSEVDMRCVGTKAIPILTKKGFLMKMNNKFYLRKTVEESWISVETDVDYEIELSDVDERACWVVMNKNDWRAQNFGAYVDRESAERKLNAVGAQDLEIVRVY